MIDNKEIQLLAKLGEQKYMNRLFKYGELYFRSIGDFAEIEEKDGNGIGDKLETAVQYNYPPNPEIKIILPDGTEHPLDNGTRISYCLYSPDKNGHIYCMSMVDFNYIDENNLKIKHPENLEKTGNGYGTMVIITNPNEFLQRIKRKVNELGYSIHYAPISYFPEKDIVRKEVTVFDKRERYSYQNEFRIVINCNLKNPLSIRIGSIKDIAMIINAPLKV